MQHDKKKVHKSFIPDLSQIHFIECQLKANTLMILSIKEGKESRRLDLALSPRKDISSFPHILVLLSSVEEAHG
jgi:hypothetical protein